MDTAEFRPCMARTALAKIPEDLFDLSPSASMQALRPTNFLSTRMDFSGREAVFDQGEGIFEQRDQIDLFELVLLAAGVCQEIGDDVFSRSDSRVTIWSN